MNAYHLSKCKALWLKCEAITIKLLCAIIQTLYMYMCFLKTTEKIFFIICILNVSVKSGVILITSSSDILTLDS